MFNSRSVVRGPSLSLAKNEFHRARLRGALAALAAHLTGRSMALLSYDDVANKLKVTGRADRGVETIPVDRIVGSVGRYNDFTRTFLPRQSSDAGRWASVRVAGEKAELPPIEVYKIGEAYFVIDGNHRVSIAMQQGVAYIDAYVTEIRTRVPLSPDDNPASLILKAEYAGFLEHTQLDRLRPGVNLAMSVPGRYATLENHIEVHRFFIETEEGVELTDQEAILRWYDEAYLPIVSAVRNQGILRHFPSRTETDFYVWLARHQVQLRNELGWEIEPDIVVKLAAQFEPQPPQEDKRISRRLLEVVNAGRARPSIPDFSWSQERLLDRYSRALFLDVLIPLAPAGSGGLSWAPALALAQKEQAQVFGLVLANQDSLEGNELAQRLEAACREVGLPVQVAWDTGPVSGAICRRAALADLVVLDGAFSQDDTLAILDQCPWPIMVLAGETTTIKRVLLAYDGSPKADEALFIAAYLAEQWPVDLVVLQVQESHRNRRASGYATRYLALHEVRATFLEKQGNVAETIGRTAVAHDCDLILLGGSGNHLLGLQAGKTVKQLLAWGQRPLIVCP